MLSLSGFTRQLAVTTYIFRAEDGNPRKASYYVYAASMCSVLSIDGQGLEETRDTINETGMGSLKGLKVVELEPTE